VQNTAALVPVGCKARSFAGQASDEFFDYTRSVSLNTDPLPGSLATVTSSPFIRASFRQIARPGPVPPSAESELALRFHQGLRLDQQTLLFVAAPALAEAHDHGASGTFRLDPAREQRISGGQKLEIVETDAP
jgi:hypothetical protein